MLKNVLYIALVGVLCLGNMQAEGEGDAYFLITEKDFEHKDYQKALAYFKKAADRGDAKAYNMLGVMYEMGKGVKKDLQKAEEYFKKACNLGYEKACEN
ncbi:tetratricopeptide repeat protein [Helicobacter suis]|uniref:tetratricopeptide repeat protein n=1 Tax=Helicobacter suis TaxID=104628 RepID=UPI001F079ADF|nr:tetratricopeptide repeat protein [Helicobacter suis]